MPRCSVCRKKSSVILQCKSCVQDCCSSCIDMSIHKCKNIDDYRNNKQKQLERELSKNKTVDSKITII